MRLLQDGLDVAEEEVADLGAERILDVGLALGVGPLPSAPTEDAVRRVNIGQPLAGVHPVREIQRDTDRAKDVIKSGGEWISSIEIENLAVSHPSVQEAAVIATSHPRWQERPLLLVHRKDGANVTKEEILKFLSDKIAKWWMPDDVVFVDELPHTATGKVLKTRLRQEYGDWLERN